MEYTGLSANEILKELKEQPNEIRERLRRRLISFYRWLRRECPRRKGEGKGISENLASAYVSAIRSFYSEHGITVKFRREGDFERSVIKKRKPLIAREVKELVDLAPTLRDRAIIITMFQSGMDAPTLCSLKYGDIYNRLDKEYPLKISLKNPKTNAEYYTFIGRDAISAIKAYLSDCEDKGIKFKSESPLFIKLSWKTRKLEGIKPHHVQNMFRKVSIKSGLVEEGKHYRISPRIMKRSFSSILLNNGVDENTVKFLTGKGIKLEYGEEELRRIYLRCEPSLSVTSKATPRTIYELMERFDKLEELLIKLNEKVDRLNRELACILKVINSFK